MCNNVFIIDNIMGQYQLKCATTNLASSLFFNYFLKESQSIIKGVLAYRAEINIQDLSLLVQARGWTKESKSLLLAFFEEFSPSAFKCELVICKSLYLYAIQQASFLL